MFCVCALLIPIYTAKLVESVSHLSRDILREH